MNNQIGLSFSEKFIHMTYFMKNGKSDTISVPYPFSFSYDKMFIPENVSAISDLLKKKIEELNIEQPQFAIALPMNFVHTKRVAIPSESDLDLLQTQVEWEFTNYLSEAIDTFKIVNTKLEYVFDSYKEVIFLAIAKQVLLALDQLSQKCQAKLNRVVPLTYLIEEMIPETHRHTNCLVVKFEKSQINSLLYISGKYYHSYFDYAQNNGEANADSLVGASKKRIQEIHNTLEQLPFVENTELKCLIYGDGLTTELEQLYIENLSDEVQKLDVSDQKQSHSGIEAVQVLQN